MTTNPPHEPSRSERLKPAELLGISGAMALFVGITALISTRDIVLSVVALGITFIIALMVIAMLALNMKPNAAEKTDLDEQDQDQNHGQDQNH